MMHANRIRFDSFSFFRFSRSSSDLSRTHVEKVLTLLDCVLCLGTRWVVATCTPRSQSREASPSPPSPRPRVSARSASVRSTLDDYGLWPMVRREAVSGATVSNGH
eukprot:6012171-Prymnesium_polylepis.1